MAASTSLPSSWTPPGPTEIPAPARPAIEDRHTLSNIAQIYSTHLHVDWLIDWDGKRIEGSVEHELRVAHAAIEHVVLDTSYLDIRRVEIDGKEVKGWKKDARKGMLGEALHVPLPKAMKLGETCKLKIDYATTEECTALGWLTKEQTAAKTAPFLYSQCQAIHARSMLPCFDSPARKVTYTSRVRSRIPVLMSALPTHAAPGDPFPSGDGEKEYTFEQRIGIPTYLIAVVGGVLDFRALGPRTGIYAEAPVVENAKWEFERDAEHFLQAAEKIVSPYSWTRYDSVVLPPSFPYGGMENANMTTLTPALVCGDRSLTDVLAHELMHSWSGNLTSCANWSSFWLNEGWTVYLERLVLQEVHGGAQSKEGPAARGFSYIIGAKALKDALEQFAGEPRFQRLVPVFKGVEDPDDAFSSVPYEKGSNFLLHIERTVGGLDVFMPYVKAYFATFFDRSVTTEEWRAHLYAFYAGSPEITKKLDNIQWDAWLYGEGVDLPVDMTKDYDSSLAEAAFALAQRWEAVITGAANNKAGAATAFGPVDIQGWNANQIVVFLEKLHSGPQVPPTVVTQLDDAYGFSKATNGEVLLRFFEVALEVKSDDDRYARQAAEWVKGQGRMKFCRTVYRALHKIEPELAKKTFVENKGFYHPIAAAQIEKVSLHRRNIIAVIGSTGTGKSQLAVELARAIERKHAEYAGADVISADSMQVYKGLDIITNKVTPKEMQGIKHHLIDFFQPGQEYAVGSFHDDTHRILSRRKPAPSLPIIAGGTTYYIQHLLFPGRLLSASAGASIYPPEVQETLDKFSPEEKQLWALIQEDDNAGELLKPEELEDPRALWDLLHKVDPLMARRWHFKDTRKVLRSLRVLQTSGKCHSQWITEQDASEKATSAGAIDLEEGPWRILLFWVWRDPQSLSTSLNARIKTMIQRGLLDEIRELRAIVKEKQGCDPAKVDYTRGIFQAIGYKEFDAYLTYQEEHGVDSTDNETGQKLFEQGIEDMEIATRQYAKKQVSWIRNKLAAEIRRVRELDNRLGRASTVDVYLLDATDDWENCVARPAKEILEAWLSKLELPDPLTLSPVAAERLAPMLSPSPASAGNAGTLEKNELRKCELCSSLMTDAPVWIRVAEWDQHRQGKAHRRAAKVQNKDQVIERAKAEGWARKMARQQHRQPSDSRDSSDFV
ncbi:hypothetical protein K437DRAFT_228230 [Tilletiaria anomala UBC 951]|uniref:Peptidase M1 leukotriene A4 hydrolase/aminopeptidase C-terminal domain-containing protein n=1 Tax=Tilletiaria anomala (strain ATCC 24038 / CBS 436.72 / UBC 951) TaxID=1037660 RepID=A0A066VB96_TILAU|nr:uncharacterized protein K437DRAFT_228230 [Tilletiaria anomala UBC 951]KDN39017.1 hypothetical protein K437DRAFT_228230 [Tilletiaria anomala UBC 951]